MSALWRVGEKGTVNQVRAAMTAGERRSYRVTQVHLDRCVEKGFCKSVVLEPKRPRREKKAGPGPRESRYYVPVVDQEKAVRERIVEFLDGALENDPESLELVGKRCWFACMR